MKKALAKGIGRSHFTILLATLLILSVISTVLLWSAADFGRQIATIAIWAAAVGAGYYLTVFGRITERLGMRLKELDLLYEASENKRRSMLDTCPMGYLVTDGHGQVVERNDVARIVLGHDASGCLEKLDLAREEPVETELSSVGTDGSKRYIRAFGYPFDLNPGEKGFVIWLKDMTEQKQAAMKVMQADKLSTIGEMVSVIAHDIRNPLTAIKSIAQVGYLMPEKIDHSLKWKRVDELVDNVNDYLTRTLSFCRSTGKDDSAVTVQDAFSNVIAILRAKIDRSRISVIQQLEEDIPPMMVNGLELQYSLINLVNNALDAIDDKGVITLSARVQGEWVEISVSDTGCGIEESELPMIWDLFYTTKPNGNGIGLTTVRKFIVGCGGKIGVLSKVGEGSTFSLTLPLAKLTGSLTA